MERARFGRNAARDARPEAPRRLKADRRIRETIPSPMPARLADGAIRGVRRGGAAISSRATDYSAQRGRSARFRGTAGRRVRRRVARRGVGLWRHRVGWLAVAGVIDPGTTVP